MIHKYKEQLIEVEAVVLTGAKENIQEVCEFCNAGVYGYMYSGEEKDVCGIVIETYDTEKKYTISVGDYVVKDESNTIFVYDEDYFLLKYKRIKDADTDIQT